MRDALSIMDQAIASAPLVEVDGQPARARLDASQIRELMGTVPNAVFERMLEAVDGNRSAEVMTVANQLLDAGNSPAQLARQCVRYLRNCLIAKIAGLGIDGAGSDGIGGELLQISADEQRRAARSASLFSEEELARFLQVMLRTFDELGYRQEQRFHFELGLLKLVHLRRLLPIEEALSQLPTAKLGAPSSTRSGAPSATKQGAPFVPELHPGMGGKVASSTPAFSPFEQDKLRRRPQMSSPIPISSAAPQPIPETHGATALELAPTPSPVPSVSDPQHSVVEALTAAAQTSAAEALADAHWTLADGEALIQTTLSKTMLSVVFNPEADKILRSVLRDAGILKLTLLPAVSAPPAKKPRSVCTGSVKARALEHPMVQQAQKLFSAEVQTVIDLREPD